MYKNLRTQGICKLGYLSIIVAFIFFNFGCESFSKKREKQNKEIIEYESTDLLRFKVKEESFRKDSLSLIFRNIYFEKIDANEFSLKINADFHGKNINDYKNYYIVVAIYPRDNEIQLLSPDRLKYKFESYSAKIGKNEVNDLMIARKIKTKLKFARAITISLFEYKTKLKSQEIVLQNVKF